MSKQVQMDLVATVTAARVMREVYQSARCACGCGGTWDRTVSGTIGGQPALWMGCCYRNGSAVGGGLTGEDYHVACAVIVAAKRHGYTAQQVVETEVVIDCGTWLRGPAEREVDTARWEAEAHRKAAREQAIAEERAERERTRPEREAKAAADRAVMDQRRAEWFAAVKSDFDVAYSAARTKQEREIVLHWKQESMSGYESDRTNAARQLRRLAEKVAA